MRYAARRPCALANQLDKAQTIKSLGISLNDDAYPRRQCRSTTVCTPECAPHPQRWAKSLATAIPVLRGYNSLSVWAECTRAFEPAIRLDALVTDTLSDTVERHTGSNACKSRLRVLIETHGALPPTTATALRQTLGAELPFDAAALT